MKYYIISDTHFGHANLQLPEYCDRPKDADAKMLNNMKIIRNYDVLIHLGDFCIGHDAVWHSVFFGNVNPIKAWLIRGNHDRKTQGWYLNHGWDYVGGSISLKVHAKDILFTHRPVELSGYDLNIHGHCHNATRTTIDDKKHILVKQEHDYRPYELRKIIGK